MTHLRRERTEMTWVRLRTILVAIFFLLLLQTSLGISTDVCQMSSNIASIPNSNTVINQTIVGPVMSSITAVDERECEMECHLAVPDLCYMFNYHPSSKVCELLYKDRSAEYKVVKKVGSTFKTRKCYSNPCLNEGECYSLGDKTSNCSCLSMLDGAVCEVCRQSLSTAIQHIDLITNYAIVGPVFKSFLITTQGICQCLCQWYDDQDSCYMFNYHPSSKVCELLYKDRPGEYKVEKKAGYTFKAPKCGVYSCVNGGTCLSVGQVNMTSNTLCFCREMFTGNVCQNHTCDFGSNITQYTDAFPNKSIVGPVLWSFVATSESACRCACEKNEQGLCYMFNFNPSTKFCELFFKNRVVEYSLVTMSGSTFKTRKCLTNPCYRGKCYSLGDQNSKICVCDPGYSGKYCHVFSKGIKVNTSPVCISGRNDAYGRFVAPYDGKAKTFRLVHISGGITHGGGTDKQGNWGGKEYWLFFHFPSQISLHITYDSKERITPPVGYPLNMFYDRMGYDVPGYTNMSPELVFPEISPITVTKGQKFRIWFGQDYTDNTENDNTGTTCADVYIYYTE